MFSSGHFLPYILLEWSEIAGPLRHFLCPDLDRLIDMFHSSGYSARDAFTLSALPDSCLQNPVTDVLWVHEDAVKIWEEEFVVECRFVNNVVYIPV